MRLLQVILVVLLAGFALLAGFMIAALVAVAGIVFAVVQLLGGRHSAARTGHPGGDPAERSREPSDVIEIAATEIPTTPLPIDGPPPSTSTADTPGGTADTDQPEETRARRRADDPSAQASSPG